MGRNDLISAAVGSVIVGALVWFILEGRGGAESDEPQPAVTIAPEAEKTAAPEPAKAPEPEAEPQAIAEGSVEESAEEAAVADTTEAAKPFAPVEEEIEEAVAEKPVEAEAGPVEEGAPAADPENEQAEAQAPAAEDIVEAKPEPKPEPEPEPEEEAQPPLQEPVFDVVRIEPDGSGLVAGRAAPGSTVEIVVEGEVVAEVVAGPDGAFVAFIQVERKAAEAAVEEQDVTETIETAAAEARSEPAEEAKDPETPPTEAAGTEDATAPEPEEAVAEATAAPPAETTIAAEAEKAPEPDNGRAAEMQAATEISVAAQSIILRAKPGETLPVVESAPVFVVGGSAPEAAPLIVQPAEAGLRLVQAPKRPAAEAVTLDTISYDAEGRVVFAGRARPEGAVRLYLGTAPIAEAAVSDDGSWRTRAAEPIEAGVYTLRLDQVDAAGKVTSRIETPFLREAITEGPVGDNTITVQSGDNLWRISENFYGEGVRYTVIYGANRSQIRDPDLIYPGQIFTIPDEPRSE